jgi:hypothetical protein
LSLAAAKIVGEEARKIEVKNATSTIPESHKRETK